jgi:hypothetical protein
MVPEPVRVYSNAALLSPAGDHLVDAAGGHRSTVVHPEPQFRPVCLRMLCPDADVTVEAAGGVVADLDNPGLAALAAHGDLSLPQVDIAAARVLRVVLDAGQLGQADAGGPEHRDDRGVSALCERPACARVL